MMGQCKECPGRQGLIDYLSQCDELSDAEDISSGLAQIEPNSLLWSNQRREILPLYHDKWDTLNEDALK